MNKLINLIYTFIPSHVSRRVVLACYDFGIVFGAAKRQAEVNHENNLAALTKRFGERRDVFIENQAELTDIALAKRYTYAYGGCGAIALHNMKLSLKETMGAEDTAKLFHELEHTATAYHGKAGFSPKALVRYLKRHRYRYNVYTGARSDEIDRMASARSNEDAKAFLFQTFLVTGYNDGRTIGERIHTVNIARTREGFVIHNGYRYDAAAKRYTESRPYRTLSDAVRHIDAAGYSAALMVVGVRK